MKKLVCLIMALMLLAVCTACSGSNGDYSKYGKSAVLELDSASAKPGSTVKLDISLNNNPGTTTIGL
ncbi:MAG: hypothetical protein IJL71_03300, partial [Oscillospiraceae bacterium]|nr:hypothetical protein [Oscillospiraceae bacterium]